MPDWTERLEDGLFRKSRDMAPPWGPLLRFLRFPAALTRDWLAGEINVRAMSLAYTTLLSLVPLMAFSISILNGLGAHGDLRYILHQFLRPLGGAATELTESIMQFVANMRGDVLGSIGLVFLVYTVITTIQKVEASFNFLWRVPRPRGVARRLTEYLAIMVLGPIVLAAAVGLMGAIRHSAVAHWLDALPWLAWTLAALGQLIPYALVTAVFTFMYAYVPNTHVEVRAAFIGGLTAGLIWALVGKVFAAFILYSSQMMAIYSGFAIVLTTLIWVYLSWLILLIGAQLAFYVQMPQYLLHGQAPIDLTGDAREQAGLAAMYLIGRDYVAGKTYWTGTALAAALDIPGTALAPVLGCLERAGLIVVTEKEEFLPARDLAGIGLISIIEAVRTQQTGRLKVSLRGVDASARVMIEVDAAIRMRLGAETLKDMIDAENAPPLLARS